MVRPYSLLTALVLFVAVLTALPCQAGTIYQGAGSALTVEAENADSVTSAGTKFWVPVDATPTATSPVGNPILPGTTNASGGVAMLTDFGITDNQSTMTYKLQFAQPGTYRLYVRCSMFEDGGNTANYGNEDSFFRPDDFDVACGTSNIVTGFSTTNVEGVFGWYNTGGNYTVTPAQVGAVLTFNVGNRESGFTMDRLAFSPVTNLSGSALDAKANSPTVVTDFTGGGADTDWSTTGNWDNGEPTTAAIALIGGGRTVALTASGEQAYDVIIGHNQAVSPGNGTLNQTGGSLAVADRIVLGEGGASGTYRMTAGTATIADGVLDGGGTSTLQVDEGTMTISAGGLSVDTLRVGLMDNDNGTSTLTVLGGAVSVGTGGEILDVGRRPNVGIPTGKSHAATADFSASSGVTIDVSQLRLGTIEGAPSGDSTVKGELKLSTSGTNSITAGSILVSDSSDRGNIALSAIRLGSGSNTIATDTFTLGGRKGAGEVTIASGGTLTLTGKSGAAVDLDLAMSVDGTGTTGTGNMNLVGGTFNATIDVLRMGKQNGGGGSATGTLSFDAGTVTANSVSMGIGSKGIGVINQRGGTFTVSGSMADGGGSSTVNVYGGTMNVGGSLTVDTLNVGYNGRVGTVNVNGAVSIGTGSQTLYWGRRDSGDSDSKAVLDFSAAPSVNVNVTNLNLGTITSGGGQQAWAEVTLSASGPNTITAASLMLGDSTQAGNTSDPTILRLGADNTINAGTFTIAGRKSAAEVKFATAGGVLTLGSQADPIDNLRIGYNNVDTGSVNQGLLNGTDGTINAWVDQVVIGHHDKGAGAGQGTLTLTDGTFNANSILLARPGATGTSSNPANTTGTINLAGGTLSAGSITKGAGAADVNFTGGILHVDSFGFTLDQDGGTLAPGRSIGTTHILGDYNQNAGLLEIEIDGTAGPGVAGGNDLLIVDGELTLNGELALLFGYDVREMDQWLILSNQGSLPTAEWEGLEEGSIFYRPGSAYPLFITYLGGDGNDVVLTAVPEPVTLLALLAGVGSIGGYVRRRRRN